MSNKKNFPVVLFVAASLCVFVLMGFFYVFLKDNQYYSIEASLGKNEKFYLNDNYSNGDLLITKNPALKDMLAGPIIGFNDPGLGSRDASVVIVVYSDFDCGFCFGQEKNIARLLFDFPDKTRFIRKDYPESDQGSMSFKKALAGRCAQEQGKFWDYHDYLYAGAEAGKEESLIAAARSIGLDNKEFVECLEGQRARELVLDNIKEANALGITGVPYIFINDRQVMGETSYEELKRMAEEEIDKVK